jgi:hypothetical protein
MANYADLPNLSKLVLLQPDVWKSIRLREERRRLLQVNS